MSGHVLGGPPWSGTGVGVGRGTRKTMKILQCFAFTHLELEESSGKMKLKSCFSTDSFLVTAVHGLALDCGL